MHEIKRKQLKQQGNGRKNRRKTGLGRLPGDLQIDCKDIQRRYMP